MKKRKKEKNILIVIAIILAIIIAGLIISNSVRESYCEAGLEGELFERGGGTPEAPDECQECMDDCEKDRDFCENTWCEEACLSSHPSCRTYGCLPPCKSACIFGSNLCSLKCPGFPCL